MDCGYRMVIDRINDWLSSKEQDEKLMALFPESILGQTLQFPSQPPKQERENEITVSTDDEDGNKIATELNRVVHSLEKDNAQSPIFFFHRASLGSLHRVNSLASMNSILIPTQMNTEMCDKLGFHVLFERGEKERNQIISKIENMVIYYIKMTFCVKSSLVLAYQSNKLV